MRTVSLRSLYCILLLVLFFICQPTAFAASWAHVACSGTCNVNGTTVPASGTLTFTVHNFLSLAIRTGSGSTLSVSSSPSETWNCGAPITSQASSGSIIEVCWANNIGGGNYTITATATPSANTFLVVDEFSGNPTGCNPIDGSQVSGISNGTNSATPLSASLTTTDTDLLYAATGIGTAVSNLSSPNPTIFGSSATVSPNQASSTRDVVLYQLNTASGSGTATFHWQTGGNTDWAIAFMGFHSTCPSSSCSPHLATLGVSSC